MDLDIVRVIKSIPEEHDFEEFQPLWTPWGEALHANKEQMPLSEHPRPQLARQSVMMLNGWWECEFKTYEDDESETGAAKAAESWKSGMLPPAVLGGRIRVPFSPEAPLSGVGRQLQPNEILWYQRRVRVPELGDNQALLHFDGVDHACSVYVGSDCVCKHEGAYQPFVVDVTGYAKYSQPDEGLIISVCVYDPSDTGIQLRGKQTLQRGGMWYTAQSGIWQSVWLEIVPDPYLEDLRVVPDPDRELMKVTAWFAGKEELIAQSALEVDVIDAEGAVVAQGGAHPAKGVGVVTFDIPLATPHLWSPDDPYLYQLRISFGEDVVESYCAFRTVSVEADEQGVKRFCLNHRPLFLRGLLDQGYWPDGLMTQPSDEALAFDIQCARDHGFNLLRKHIKVESERWYWHCDRLGMLVWQDMPSGGEKPRNWESRDCPTLFRHSWHSLRDDNPRGRERLGAGSPTYRKIWTENMAATISRLSNHPCIVTWVLFNESWGQFDAGLATQMAWEMDATRPVCSTSGWYDQGTGDYHTVHNYFRKMHIFADPYGNRKENHAERAHMLSEFGGLPWRIADHSCIDRIYGYAQYETMEEWRRGFDELIASVDALEAKGLSGWVYTEVSDIEEEVNGILTYDRRVCKLD